MCSWLFHTIQLFRLPPRSVRDRVPLNLTQPPKPPHATPNLQTNPINEHHKEGLKHALHRIFYHFGWSQYQKNQFRKCTFLSCGGWNTALAGCDLAPLGAPPSPNTQIGWKTHKEGLKSALHSMFLHCEYSQSQKYFLQNSVAFGKSTSQRIYPKQQTPKIEYKLHKYKLKHALHVLDGHSR